MIKTAQRIILLPGLAADERMYDQLGGLPFELLTPRLLVPQAEESMADYARRHAEWLNIGSDDIVGGCSFGSMVAGEICRQRQTRGLVLLGGALSATALPEVAHRLRLFARFIPFGIMRQVMMNKLFLRAVFGTADEQYLELGRAMIKDTPRELLVYGQHLAATYSPDQQVLCEVCALHGGQDRVLSPPEVDMCEIVADAGHGLVVSHPQVVDEFLIKVCGLTQNVW